MSVINPQIKTLQRELSCNEELEDLDFGSFRIRKDWKAWQEHECLFFAIPSLPCTYSPHGSDTRILH